MSQFGNGRPSDQKKDASFSFGIQDSFATRNPFSVVADSADAKSEASSLQQSTTPSESVFTLNTGTPSPSATVSESGFTFGVEVSSQFTTPSDSVFTFGARTPSPSATVSESGFTFGAEVSSQSTASSELSFSFNTGPVVQSAAAFRSKVSRGQGFFKKSGSASLENKDAKSPGLPGLAVNLPNFMQLPAAKEVSSLSLNTYYVPLLGTPSSASQALIEQDRINPNRKKQNYLDHTELVTVLTKLELAVDEKEINQFTEEAKKLAADEKQWRAPGSSLNLLSWCCNNWTMEKNKGNIPHKEMRSRAFDLLLATPIGQTVKHFDTEHGNILHALLEHNLFDSAKTYRLIDRDEKITDRRTFDIHLNQKDAVGTPLMKFVSKQFNQNQEDGVPIIGFKETLTWLLEVGADINTVGQNNQTLLHVISLNSSVNTTVLAIESMELLIQNKINMFIKDSNNNPFTSYLERSKTTILLYLFLIGCRFKKLPSLPPPSRYFSQFANPKDFWDWWLIETNKKFDNQKTRELLASLYNELSTKSTFLPVLAADEKVTATTPVLTGSSDEKNTATAPMLTGSSDEESMLLPSLPSKNIEYFDPLESEMSTLSQTLRQATKLPASVVSLVGEYVSGRAYFTKLSPLMEWTHESKDLLKILQKALDEKYSPDIPEKNSADTKVEESEIALKNRQLQIALKNRQLQKELRETTVRNNIPINLNSWKLTINQLITVGNAELQKAVRETEDFREQVNKFFIELTTFWFRQSEWMKSNFPEEKFALLLKFYCYINRISSNELLYHCIDLSSNVLFHYNELNPIILHYLISFGASLKPSQLDKKPVLHHLYLQGRKNGSNPDFRNVLLLEEGRDLITIPFWDDELSQPFPHRIASDLGQHIAKFNGQIYDYALYHLETLFNVISEVQDKNAARYINMTDHNNETIAHRLVKVWLSLPNKNRLHIPPVYLFDIFKKHALDLETLNAEGISLLSLISNSLFPLYDKVKKELYDLVVKYYQERFGRLFFYKRYLSDIIHGHVEIFKEFLSQKEGIELIKLANFWNHQNRVIYKTFLHMLVENGYLEKIIIFQSCQPDLFKDQLNIRDSNGNTPILLLAKKIHEECINSDRVTVTDDVQKDRIALFIFLLNNGATLQVSNNEGYTVFSYIIEANYSELIKILQEYPAAFFNPEGYVSFHDFFLKRMQYSNDERSIMSAKNAYLLLQSLPNWSSNNIRALDFNSATTRAWNFCDLGKPYYFQKKNGDGLTMLHLLALRLVYFEKTMVTVHEKKGEKEYKYDKNLLAKRVYKIIALIAASEDFLQKDKSGQTAIDIFAQASPIYFLLIWKTLYSVSERGNILDVSVIAQVKAKLQQVPPHGSWSKWLVDVYWSCTVLPPAQPNHRDEKLENAAIVAETLRNELAFFLLTNSPSTEIFLSDFSKVLLDEKSANRLRDLYTTNGSQKDVFTKVIENFFNSVFVCLPPSVASWTDYIHNHLPWMETLFLTTKTAQEEKAKLVIIAEPTAQVTVSSLRL